jgi:hypothetical protein
MMMQGEFDFSPETQRLVTDEEIASIFGCKVRDIRRAREVRRLAPDLADLVKRGRLPLAVALRNARERAKAGAP